MCLDRTVNYLPVGSNEATKYWAVKCLDQGISFLNAIPSFIVSDKLWSTRFEEAGLPCAGDDVKSQIGATIIHRALVRLFSSRGGTLINSYQLNFGGNMDFLNMMDEGRLRSKKLSKLSSVRHELGDQPEPQLHISPTDYVQFLGDHKIAYINLSGHAFAGSDIEIECRLKVWDSNNSAGVVIDVIRFLAAARLASVAGPIPICPFYFKSPPYNLPDDEAERIVRTLAEREMPVK
jgi:myo-inositol-1-phosphate synthase